MILSGSLRRASMEKFFGQKAHFEIKSFTELVTEHLMKFEKEIDGYFSSLGKMSLHILEILLLQTLRCCRLKQILKRNWLNSNMMVLHAMCILRNSYVNF